MKSLAHSVTAHHGAHVLPRWRAAVRDDLVGEEVIPATESAPVPRSGLTFSGPVRAVVILAFCQSLVFLVLWLVVCASAGASTVDDQPVGSEMRKSTYAPTRTRDPFVVPVPVVQEKPVAARVEPADTSDKPAEQPSAPVVNLVPVNFNLQGTLYQAGNPIALVNGAMLALNKSAMIMAGNHRLEVTPVEITRERVKLRAGDRTVELQMAKPRSTVDLPENLLR